MLNSEEVYYSTKLWQLETGLEDESTKLSVTTSQLGVTSKKNWDLMHLLDFFFFLIPIQNYIKLLIKYHANITFI